MSLLENRRYSMGQKILFLSLRPRKTIFLTPILYRRFSGNLTQFCYNTTTTTTTTKLLLLLQYVLLLLLLPPPLLILPYKCCMRGAGGSPYDGCCKHLAPLGRPGSSRRDGGAWRADGRYFTAKCWKPAFEIPHVDGRQSIILAKGTPNQTWPNFPPSENPFQNVRVHDFLLEKTHPLPSHVFLDHLEAFLFFLGWIGPESIQ